MVVGSSGELTSIVPLHPDGPSRQRFSDSRQTTDKEPAVISFFTVPSHHGSGEVTKNWLVLGLKIPSWARPAAVVSRGMGTSPDTPPHPTIRNCPVLESQIHQTPSKDSQH